MRSSHLVAVLVAVFVPGLGAQTIRHVDAAAVPGGDGTSWATAYADLQDALREPGVDEVWIAEGRYLPDSGTVDWKLSFVLPPGIELLGGFRGDEDQRDQRDPALYRTELSGDLLGDDGANFTGRDENTRHVIDASGATPDTDRKSVV